MFRIPEKRLLSDPYFRILRTTDMFYEIQSKNTGHCWQIFKPPVFPEGFPIALYHKHKLSDPYYHKHALARTTKSALEKIKNHDQYVLQSNPSSSVKKSRYQALTQ